MEPYFTISEIVRVDLGNTRYIPNSNYESFHKQTGYVVGYVVSLIQPDYYKVKMFYDDRVVDIPANQLRKV